MKLPDIQQSGAAQLPAMGQGANLAKARSRLDTQEAIYQLGDAVAEVKTEHDVTVATADYAQHVTDYKKSVADKPYATRAELEQMGILDDVDTQDANGREMEVIPQWKWYAAGLEKTMEANIEVQGGRIGNPAARNKWEFSTRDVNRQEIENAVVASGNMAIKSEVELATAEYKNAVNSGKYDKARHLLDNSPLLNMDPAVTSTLRLELDQQEEIGLIFERFETGDPDVIEATLLEMSSEAYLNTSNLDVEKRRQVRDVGYNRLVALSVSGREMRKEAGDAVAADIMIEISKNPGVDFTPQIEANKSILGRTGVSALLKHQSAVGSGEANGSKTAPGVMSLFESMAYLMEFNIVPDGSTYQEQWEKAAFFVSQQLSTYDEASGTVIPGATATDLNKMQDELRRLKEAPQASPGYKAAVKELDLKILKYDSDNPFAIRPDPSTVPEYLEGLRQLSEFGQSEGPMADFAGWARTTIPQLQSAESKAAFMRLPDSITDMAVIVSDTNGDYVSAKETDAAFKAAVAQKMANLEDADNDREEKAAQKALDRLEDDLAEWEAYKNGKGASNVR